MMKRSERIAKRKEDMTPFGDACEVKLQPIIQHVYMTSPSDISRNDTPHLELPDKIKVYKRPETATKTVTPPPSKYIPPSQRIDSDDWTETTTSLKMTNLPDYITDSELVQLLKKCGYVKKIKIVNNGIAYITMATHKQALDVVMKLDKERIHHMIIDVELVKPYKKSNL